VLLLVGGIMGFSKVGTSIALAFMLFVIDEVPFMV